VRVERIGFVGRRTDDVDAMTSFCRDMIGFFVRTPDGRVFAIEQVAD
jgi:hypothetical protein